MLCIYSGAGVLNDFILGTLRSYIGDVHENGFHFFFGRLLQIAQLLKCYLITIIIITLFKSQTSSTVQFLTLIGRLFKISLFYFICKSLHTKLCAWSLQKSPPPPAAWPEIGDISGLKWGAQIQTNSYCTSLTEWSSVKANRSQILQKIDIVQIFPVLPVVGMMLRPQTRLFIFTSGRQFWPKVASIQSLFVNINVPFLCCGSGISRSY